MHSSAADTAPEADRMTFSIVARSPDGSELGVAVASKFLAVGNAVPAAEAGVGAIATQSYANLSYRPDGLALLRDGCTAAEVVGRLTAADEQHAKRQVGVVAATGEGASYTGSACHDWAGGRTGDGYAVQGNILTGPGVVEAMERVFLETSGALADRLLAALAAGDAAGGDSRGRQSAALLVVSPGGYGGESDVKVDLRVDDHPAPVTELRRLLGLHELLFGTADPADLLPLDGELLDEVRRAVSALGHPPADGGTTSVMAALRDWAGIENLEERVGADRAIDPVVLAVLREKSGAA
jgi:uncharacterized Ntn-hydrolase superfamily protein